MITRVKKNFSILLMLCVLAMNFNLGFATFTEGQSGLQPVLQNLSVTESIYSQTSSTPTVTEVVYATFESMPTPTITPTITPTLAPTMKPTPTSVSYSVYQETVDYGNDIYNAFAISDKTSVSGGVNNSDFLDFFSFTSDLDIDIIVQISCGNCVIAAILDENGNEITSREDHGGYNFNLNFHAEKGSKYYIKMASAHPGEYMNYTIKIISLIDDYSDDFYTATEISVGQGIVGNFVNNTDVDCFKLIPDKKGLYNISSIVSNYIIEVFNESGTQIAVSKNYTNLDANKTYYIKVSKNSEYNNIFAYDFFIKGPIEDDYGNTPQTSHEIKLDEKVTGNLNYLVDSDCFCFKPSEDGIYYITDFIATVNEGYSLPPLSSVLSVFDQDNNFIGFNYDNNSKAYFDLSKDKTYYLCISNDNYSLLFDYSFSIKGPIIDDIGNTIESSKEIQLDKQIKGNINYLFDFDYLSFIPSVDGTYYIEDFSATANSGYSTPYLSEVFAIVDSDNNSKNIISNSNSKVYFNLVKNKTYYIRIANNNYYSTFDYSFTVRGPIKDDFGSTKETAKEIQAGDQIQGSADYYYDADFFSYKPKVSGTYAIDNFTVDNNNISLSNSLAITDSYGNTVNVTFVNSKAYFSLLKDVNYFISLTNNGYYSVTYNYSFMLKGPFIDDYGDTKALATDIKLDISIKGFANFNGDTDYFRFFPLAAGIYYIDDFTSVGSYYYSQYINNIVRVIDSKGNTVTVNYDTNSNKKAYFSLEKDSVYYIYIQNTYNNTVFDYSFTLKGPILDDYGNAKEFASEIKLDEEVKGSINYFGDNDFFSFKPSATGIYYIDSYKKTVLSGSDYNTSIGNVVKVIDSNGNFISMSFDNASYDSSSTQKAYFSLVKDSIYFIYIKNGEYSSTFNYSFLLKGPIIDDCGNTASYAKKLELGKTAIGKLDYPSDNDSYYFTTGAKGYYYISVPGSDISISLYDESNVQVNQSSFSLDNTKPYYYLRANQAYYVNIRAAYYSSSRSVSEYKIYVNGPIIDESSGLIARLGDNNASINFSGDADIFKFIPSTSGTYYFKLNSSINLSMKISIDSYSYDSNFQYKVINENTISSYLNANNTYNITVSNNMDILAIGDYVLSISDNLEDITTKTFKITGYVKPDFTDKLSGSMRSGFTISLYGTKLSAISDENGYFEIAGVPKSATGYDIVISKDNYLKREIKNIAVSDNVQLSKSEAPIELWAGDIGEYQDGAINMLDILCIAKAYNSIKGDSGYLESVDLNKDSVINLMDVIIAAKHFNESTRNYEQL